VWPDLLIATVSQHTKHKRVVEVTRRMTQGALARAQDLLTQSQGGTVLNAAFIERLNATFRERLATLTRCCRHAAVRLEALETGMYLVGCVYNFCVAHDELSSSKHFGRPTTSAMAAGLTAHQWSVKELLLFQVAPPACVEPKRRGRPRLAASTRRSCKSRRLEHLRPLLRLRKGTLRALTG
ncbi:MAG TPA: hypothetical protein VF026_22680, partial [Ktedonobacteraceae bacterium]